MPVTYTINGLVQDNLGLVELLLNLGNAASLVGVLVIPYEVLENGKGDRVVRLGGVYCGERLLGEEGVHQLGQDAVGGDGGVLLGDDDAGDTFRAAVAVYHIVWSYI